MRRKTSFPVNTYCLRHKGASADELLNAISPFMKTSCPFDVDFSRELRMLPSGHECLSFSPASAESTCVSSQNSVQNNRFHVSQAGSRSGLRTHVPAADPKGLFRDSGNGLRITVVALYPLAISLVWVASPTLHIPRFAVVQSLDVS